MHTDIQERKELAVNLMSSESLYFQCNMFVANIRQIKAECYRRDLLINFLTSLFGSGFNYKIRELKNQVQRKIMEDDIDLENVTTSKVQGAIIDGINSYR